MTSVAIPLGDIAAKATETSTFLTNLATNATQSAQDQNIANSVPALSKRLDERLRETKETLETEPTLEMLQTLQQGWQRDQVETSAGLNTLTRHASRLQNGLNQLDIVRQTWSNTRLSAEQSNVPAPILERIDSTLAAISEAQAKLQTERTAILNLQSRVAEDLSKCTTALAQIAQAQQTAVAGILAPNASPIWRVDLWPNAIHALPRHVREVTHARWFDFVRYVREPREGSGFHAAIFLVLAFLFAGARRKVRGWMKSGVPTAPALAVFMRPFSAALAITLVYATSPFVELAASVRQIFLIAVLVPILRVIQPLVTRSTAALSYAVCVVFAVEIVRQAYTGVPLIGQTILVVENLAAIIALFWIQKDYRQIIAERAESSQAVVLKAVRSIVLAVLIISFLAGVAGYLRLARLLTAGTLVGGVLALAAFVYIQVSSGAVAVLFQVWPLRTLQLVQHHRELLQKRIFPFWSGLASLAGWRVTSLIWGFWIPRGHWLKPCSGPGWSAVRYQYQSAMWSNSF